LNIKRNGNRKNNHNDLKKIPKDYSIIFHKVFDKLKCKKIINTLKQALFYLRESSYKLKIFILLV